MDIIQIEIDLVQLKFEIYIHLFLNFYWIEIFVWKSKDNPKSENNIDVGAFVCTASE